MNQLLEKILEKDMKSLKLEQQDLLKKLLKKASVPKILMELGLVKVMLIYLICI